MEYRADNEGGHDLAILDLGSNSLRMLLLHVKDGRAAEVLARRKKMVRLGEGAFYRGTLQPEPMRRTLEALGEFASLCRDMGVCVHVAYATSAMRDAGNGREFAEEIRKRTGFCFHIISGEEEARLIGLGVVSCMPPFQGCRMVVDVGGGSTEVALMEGRNVLDAFSLKAGAVRMAEMLPPGKGPVHLEAYESLKERVRSVVRPSLERIRLNGPMEMVGSSGSVKCLVRMEAALRDPEDGDAAEGFLSLSGLKQAAGKLCSLDEEARAGLSGMNAKRSGIIIPGAAVLEVLMEEAGFSNMRFSAGGLREGILEEYLASLRANAHKT